MMVGITAVYFLTNLRCCYRLPAFSPVLKSLLPQRIGAMATSDGEGNDSGES